MSIEAIARAAHKRWQGRTVRGLGLDKAMLAMAGAESGYDPASAGDPLSIYPDGGQAQVPYSVDGMTSIGAWQINMPSHTELLQELTGSTDPKVWAEWLSDPENCAAAADAIIGCDDQDLPIDALHPWTTWFSPDGNPDHNAGDGNGIYLQHWDEARDAIDALEAAPVQEPVTAPAAEPQPAPPAARTEVLIQDGAGNHLGDGWLEGNLTVAGVRPLLEALGFTVTWDAGGPVPVVTIAPAAAKPAETAPTTQVTIGDPGAGV